jgi:2-keto-4-pentenoate hydratase/2-oxohepta-3-ene-1,7-dioic acid hydratase in catechol pathway
MKLASIRSSAETYRAVAVVDEEVVDLNGVDSSLPTEMTELLGVTDLAERVAAAVESGQGRSPLDRRSLAAPVPRPRKFFGVGLNYADHVAEAGLPTPEYPTVFAKMPTCVTGPYDDVERPIVSEDLDYEGEMGFVIGKRCRHVSKEDAAGVIAGYVAINDLSVRDYQLRAQQWTLGKSFDTHGPFGPWIVTADEIDPHALDLKTIVNGETRQHSNTSNLIFDCFEQIELLSSVCTLEPGDVVATGTCGGVGLSFDPPRFLVPGDVVRVEIEGIGALENTVVAEQAPAGRAAGAGAGQA